MLNPPSSSPLPLSKSQQLICFQTHPSDVEEPEKFADTSKRSRSIDLNQDHILAERKRRENISEQLFTLSMIIPGLKKRDKLSILMHTIDYLKQMEEKVKTLEEQASKETVEPSVSTTKSQLSVASDEGEESVPSAHSTLPEIEAKISATAVFIRIHCKNRRGVTLKVLGEIEKLHLSVINSSSLPFSDHFLDINVTAQVEEGFAMTVKDLLKKLNSAFRNFM
ncbi:uncharacterized protein A4U43_C09F6070 [Asparagus officinalis]|uniref:BHLH domain-containing protein n=1 Tax=Asparagus officinalis TaxID=4686 RepID=A0A5P1E5N9_ASPOF|nr:transcription factor bHLH18-like [Asparagus officinalis]XP_020246912.1 transcription factor bHLH18-like [Asparagus officinalis]XP_020246913.1 transcription factor bHLH18-like [Asparagus officinalis]ONK57954.1 uncharacterized protein A4U43_C09F6070 [Asparagus officinalis]